MPRIEPDSIDDDKDYAIEGEALQRIWAVAKRLYGPMSLRPGEMLRLAKQLDYALRYIEELD